MAAKRASCWLFWDLRPRSPPEKPRQGIEFLRFQHERCAEVGGHGGAAYGEEDEEACGEIRAVAEEGGAGPRHGVHGGTGGQSLRKGEEEAAAVDAADLAPGSGEGEDGEH